MDGPTGPPAVPPPPGGVTSVEATAAVPRAGRDGLTSPAGCGQTGVDPHPLVAAVEAAKVAWLAVRYAETELLAAPLARRPAALTRLTAASRQLVEALKLVAAAKTASDTRVEQATAESQHRVAPRLFGGAG